MYKGGFTVIQQNIRSFRANFDLFLLKFNILVTKPDVIILSEIWIDDHEVVQYHIPNFVTYANCNNKSRAGGIIVFLSDKITGCKMDIADYRSADIVGLKLKLSPDIFISVLAVYRLHEYHADVFVEEFDNLLSGLNDNNLLISGDINIDLLKKTSLSENYLLRMASHGLFSLIDQPTRITEETNSCIDHILFRRSPKFNIDYTSWLIDSDITDHMMTAVHLALPCKDKNNSKDIVFSKIDFTKLKLCTERADWTNIYDIKDVSLAFDVFIHKIQQLLLNSKSEVVKRSAKKIKPWMNNDLLQLIDRKNKLFKKTLLQPHNQALKDAYKIFKNNLITLMRQTKQEFYQQQFSNNSKNTRMQWKIVNELTGCKINSNDQIILRDVNNSILQDPGEVAQKFNLFFLTIADKLRNNIEVDLNVIDVAGNEFANNFVQSSFKNSMFFYPTTVTEIRQIVNLLENRKAPGFDEITPLVLKAIISHIENELVYLVNLSLGTGIFPNVLKQAVLIPLYKKGEETDPTNYRPIALLSIFSKIIEKVVKIRLMNFLDQCSFFSRNQYGFRKKKNTTNALLDFIAQVHDGLNLNNYCSGIFVDVMKAFDTVDHSILLTRMYDAGIRGIPYYWFKSYLTNRSHVTRVGGINSNEGVIKHGIPQGSVLSGPLFLIYVNNLCNGQFKGNLIAFADDTALFYKSESLEQLKTDMQDDLNVLRWWFTKNYMVMSPKTKYMIFNLSHNASFLHPLIYHKSNCNSNSNCQCQEIEQVDNIKYLGLVVDSKISWKNHVESLKHKLLKYIRIFYMLKTVCKMEVLRSVYFALISSKLEYAIEIWGGTYFSTIKSIVILQKYFVRIISNKRKFDHTAQLFKDLKILPFRNLFIFKVLKLFYDRSGEDRYSLSLRSKSLRHCYNVSVPKPKLTVFKKFYTYLAPKCFNLMPIEIKTCLEKKKFCKLVKNYLLEHESVEVFFNSLM